MTVGIVVADSAAPVVAPAVAAAELRLPDAGVLRELASAVPGSVGALARAEEIATEVLTAPSAEERRNDGLRAAVITLVICWGQLVGAGAVWRHRLAARDLSDWADGWARVEPDWSGRTV
jgi:hypothetical protein